ncbi:MAG: 2-hydroxychromene-2-carboxylate isomerase [Pseudomonadota bacterium]
MGAVIDYYFAPISGYAYLGHKTLMDVARSHGATVRFLPLVIGKVFAAAETTPPFAQSAPRKSYRIADQARWAKRRGLDMNAVPKFWPTDPVPACKAIFAAGQMGADQDAATFACLHAVWAEERNIADSETLSDILAGAGLPAQEIMDAAEDPALDAEIDAIAGNAIAAEVFGSPTYMVGDQRFWGQDRLDFVAEALASEAA